MSIFIAETSCQWPVVGGQLNITSLSWAGHWPPTTDHCSRSLPATPPATSYELVSAPDPVSPRTLRRREFRKAVSLSALSPELQILNLADLALPIEHCTTNQVAQVRPARLQFRAVASRKLKFSAHQRLGVGNRSDALKSQHQKALMRPEILNHDFAALAVFRERPQPHVSPEAVRNSGVQFSRYFSTASLRFDHDRQGNPFAACARCRDSMISCSTIFCSTIFYSLLLLLND